MVNAVHGMQQSGLLGIILCSEAARRLVKQSTTRDLPELVVLSVPEIVQDIIAEGVGEISLKIKEETAVSSPAVEG